MGIIQRYHPEIHSILSKAQPARLGKLDDWVDAAILAIAAFQALKTGLTTIPDNPTVDALKISMAIHLPAEIISA
jgi:predicted RNase H-like nuclease